MSRQLLFYEETRPVSPGLHLDWSTASVRVRLPSGSKVELNGFLTPAFDP